MVHRDNSAPILIAARIGEEAMRFPRENIVQLTTDVNSRPRPQRNDRYPEDAHPGCELNATARAAFDAVDRDSCSVV
jgi:hypothetical protein